MRRILNFSRAVEVVSPVLVLGSKFNASCRLLKVILVQRTVCTALALKTVLNATEV